MILDPRFRTKAFRNQRACENAIYGLINKIGRVQLLQQRENRDTSVAIPTPSDSSASSSSSNRNENKKDSIWNEYDQEIRKITKPDNQFAAGIRELDKNLNEEYLDRKEDSLQWWHERRPYILMFTHIC